MPEFNIIQRPELLLELSKRLGLKQAHVTPTLNEGVQAVVVVEDLTIERKAEASFHRYLRIGSFGPVVANNPWMGLYNLTTREIQDAGLAGGEETPLHMKRVHLSSITLGGAAASLVICSVEAGRFPGAPAGATVVAAPWDKTLGATADHVNGRDTAGVGFIPGGTLCFLTTVAQATGAEDYAFGNDSLLLPGYTFWVFADTNNFDLDVVIEFESLDPRRR